MRRNEESKEVGLELPDRILKRLSGPASIAYLRPKSTAFLTQERVHQPLIMLFGDVHRSTKHLCDPCDAPDCHAIYDPVFLKQLNELANVPGGPYPIDFYTESTRDHYPSEFDEDILFRDFLEATLPCHGRVRRSRPNYQDCPSPNIRWHYADPRFMLDDMEGYLFRPFIDQCYNISIQQSITTYPTLHHTHQILLEMHDELFYSEPFTGLHELLSRMVDVMLRSTETIHPLDKYEALFLPYLEYGLRRPYSVVIKQWKKLDASLDKPLGLKGAVRFFAEAFHHASKKRVKGDDLDLSSLERQISIFSTPLITYLRTFFTPSFTRLEVDLDPKNKNASGLLDDIEKEYGKEANYWVWYGFKILANFVLNVESFLVEFYTLFRMMKPPQQSSLPYLVFGFFGAAHSYSMSRILQLAPYFDYELVYETTQIRLPNRCLTFTQYIPLASDLQKHAQYIFQNQGAQHTLRQYHRILKNEAFQREAGRFGQLPNAYKHQPVVKSKPKNVSNNDAVQPIVIEKNGPYAGGAYTRRNRKNRSYHLKSKKSQKNQKSRKRAIAWL
jgi:hypothetical protein